MLTGAIAAVEKIRFHQGELKSKMKLHVTVGHSTLMATATFFGLPDSRSSSSMASIALRIGRLSVKVCYPSFLCTGASGNMAARLGCVWSSA